MDALTILRSVPGLYLILDPNFTIVEVTDAYLAATKTERAAVLGRGIFEVFPDNPDDPHAEGVRNLRASLERVRRERVVDAMPVQKYDIQRPVEEGGGFEERYWSPTNTPVMGPDGQLTNIVHRVEDVTEFLQAGRHAASQQQRSAELDHRVQEMAAEIFARNVEVAETSRQLKEVNAELARLYETTRDLAQAKSQFFASVSHELRTPLTLILAPLERLLTAIGNDDPRQRDLRLARRNALVLLSHVNALLDAAKLEAGGVALSFSEVELAALVRAAAAFFESRAAERNIDLAVVAPPGPIPAQLDVEQVRRVVFNLLANALAFTPDSGRIRLEVSGTRSHVVLEVADSGPGIPEAERQAIFEPFRQGSSPRATSASGTGLGLSIVRDLVALHGGTVAVSGAPEGGALFRITLPATAPPEATVHPAEPLSRDGVRAPGDVGPPIEVAPESRAEVHRGQVVLVVEDNPELAALIGDALRPTYSVITAPDGLDGLVQARMHRPSLIITDVMMPAMEGGELLAEIRQDPDLATTPVLVITARADDVGRLELIRAGASDYLVKPFSLYELTTRAANLLALSEAESRLRQLHITDDRARIARDLHDLVIQHLFAAGSRLHAVSTQPMPDLVRDRIDETISHLDSVITQIRSTIFDLKRGAATESLRTEATRLTVDAAERIGCVPTITFRGAVDHAIDDMTASHLLAALREILSNAVRHSHATTIAVDIDASSEDAVLTVTDDGAGIQEAFSPGLGLNNLTARAEALNGSFSLTDAVPRGTVARWSAPLRGERHERRPGGG